MAHAEKNPGPTEGSGTTPTDLYEARISSNISQWEHFAFLDDARICAGYNCVGWVREFFFFSYRNNKLNIKDCEVIFKVDRNKDWQAACFLAGVRLAGDGELFHWRYAEKNAQFLFLSRSKYCQNTEKSPFLV